MLIEPLAKNWTHDYHPAATESWEGPGNKAITHHHDIVLGELTCCGARHVWSPTV